MFALLVAFVVFANADEYGNLLKAGQREFSSNGLKQGDNGVKYSMKLVERYHSLDHDEEVESIICGDDSVLMVANQELKDWKAGDVFTGDSRWECDSGVSRIVEDIQLRKKDGDKFEYFVKTKQAELTDIFEELDIEFVNPNEEAEEEIIDGEQKNLKGAVSSYKKSFTYTKTVTVINTSKLTSTITGTITVPVELSGLKATVEKVNNKKATTYKMTLKSGVKFTLTNKNVLTASYSKSVEKDFYNWYRVQIDIIAGPVVVTVKITPETAVGATFGLNGKATATLKYTKQYSMTINFNSHASSKITYSKADLTPSASPTFTSTAAFSGSVSPYVRAGIKVGVGLYGITLVSGTPSLKLQFTSTITKKKITVQPQLIFGYSMKFLWFDDIDMYERVIASATAKSVTYK